MAFGEIDQIEHIGREAEAVAELLDEDTDVDNRQRSVSGETEIHECQAGERHAPCHRAQPEAESAARGHDAANNAAEREPDDSHSAVDHPDLRGAQTEPSGLRRVEEEGVDELDQLGLRQAVEEHEDNCHPDLLLSEEFGEDIDKFTPHIRSRAQFSGLAFHLGHGP